MQLWLILALFSYFFTSISSTLDKHMMNRSYEIYSTSLIKNLLDGIILLLLGIFFLSFSVTKDLIVHYFILGGIAALGFILYFVVLKREDISVVYPTLLSMQILMVFISSIFLFNEYIGLVNILGFVLILIGTYLVLLKKEIKSIKLLKLSPVVWFLIVVNVIYVLYVKFKLTTADPLTLATAIYFTTTLVLFAYLLIFRRKILVSVSKIIPNLKIISLAAFFGSIGTFLLFYALSIGNASKVYTLVGVQCVFIFIASTLFLKEKPTWYKFVGSILVFGGIYLISI